MSGFLAGETLLIGLELSAECGFSGGLLPGFECEVVVVLTFEEIVGHIGVKFFFKISAICGENKGKVIFCG